MLVSDHGYGQLYARDCVGPRLDLYCTPPEGLLVLVSTGWQRSVFDTLECLFRESCTRRPATPEDLRTAVRQFPELWASVRQVCPSEWLADFDAWLTERGFKC